MTDETRDPAASLGSVQPVLYAVMQAESVLEYCRDEKEAAASAGYFNGNVVPLYRSPTLTDAEREILPVISKTIRGRGWRDWSDVIDGLLERLGGGR